MSAIVQILETNNTGTQTAIPLSTGFSPLVVLGNFSIALGNGTLENPPVFQACTSSGLCSLSNTTNPLGQIFTTQGVPWWVIVSSVVGSLLLIGGGGAIFYFGYYRKRKRQTFIMRLDKKGAV